jgi:hypothetical protein
MSQHHDNTISYVFFGGQCALVSAAIASVTNSALTHVGIKFRVDWPIVVRLKAGNLLTIPRGTWILHASNQEYPTSLGGVHDGVIITPIKDLYDSYPEIQVIHHTQQDRTSNERYQALVAFIGQHFGDAYGLYDLFWPGTLITGHLVNSRPVCTTLVIQWLHQIECFTDTNFEGPRGLYQRMVHASDYFIGDETPVSAPADTVVIIIILVGALLFMGILSSWRRSTY